VRSLPPPPPGMNIDMSSRRVALDALLERPAAARGQKKGLTQWRKGTGRSRRTQFGNAG